ncbi:MAG TPA: sulfotransferase [Solirubrobacterales bacterium]
MNAERPPAPFIVGVMRSGTTLLRLMLDAHPAMAIPPETHFVPKLIKRMRKGTRDADGVLEVITSGTRWPDFHLDAEVLRERLREREPLDPGTALRVFYEAYAERFGKPRWGDKTPGYGKRLIRISRALPEARFIHVIRDGRDVALSRRRRATNPAPVEKHAKRWQARIKSTRRRARSVSHYIEERYEELVLDPEPVLRRVCEFIELDYDPVMLRYYERAEERLQEIANPFAKMSVERRLEAHRLAAQPPQRGRIGAWREGMTPAEIAEFEAAAGAMLDELGYERANPS